MPNLTGENLRAALQNVLPSDLSVNLDPIDRKQIKYMLPVLMNFADDHQGSIEGNDEVVWERLLKSLPPIVQVTIARLLIGNYEKENVGVSPFNLGIDSKKESELKAQISFNALSGVLTVGGNEVYRIENPIKRVLFAVLCDCMVPRAKSARQSSLKLNELIDILDGFQPNEKPIYLTTIKKANELSYSDLIKDKLKKHNYLEGRAAQVIQPVRELLNELQQVSELPTLFIVEEVDVLVAKICEEEQYQDECEADEDLAGEYTLILRKVRVELKELSLEFLYDRYEPEISILVKNICRNKGYSSDECSTEAFTRITRLGKINLRIPINYNYQESIVTFLNDPGYSKKISPEAKKLLEFLLTQGSSGAPAERIISALGKRSLKPDQQLPYLNRTAKKLNQTTIFSQFDLIEREKATDGTFWYRINSTNYQLSVSNPGEIR